MTENYTIRQAAVDDAEFIIHQRNAMFSAMGVDLAKIQTWENPFRLWVSARLQSGEYLGWLAVASDGQVIAGAGLWLHDWLPSPMTASPRRGYVMNVFTEPEHRQQGLARRLVEQAVAYCGAHDIPTVVLHATDPGRPIYEAIGFSATNEMRLLLE